MDSFHGIDVSGAFRMTVLVGPAARVEVSGDDNIVPLVRSEVRDSILHFELPGRITTKLPITIDLTMPQLDELDVGGASTVEVTGISGSALEVDAGGASTVSLAGEVQSLDAEVGGASTLRAEGLAAAQVDVDAGGASTAEVRAVKSLTAEASGASTIRYHGAPAKVSQDASGASTIEAAD